MRLIEFAESTTQGRRFLISAPTAGSRLTHQMSPRSIFIPVEGFPRLHVLIYGREVVCLFGRFLQGRALALQSARDQVGDEFRALAARDMRAKLLHQWWRKLKGHFHFGTMPHTIRSLQYPCLGVTATFRGGLWAPSRHQVEILRKCLDESVIGDLMAVAGRSGRTKFRNQVLKPLLDAKWVAMAILRCVDNWVGFFKNRIRPILVERRYKCSSAVCKKEASAPCFGGFGVRR